MRLNRLLILLGCLMCLSLPCALIGQEPPPAGSHPTTNNKIVVPTDTTIPLVLNNAISSRTAYVGQSVYCQTIYPITVGNRIVIPAGTYVKGSVTQVVRPGRVKGKAQIGLRFESLTMANGITRPLRATLSGFAGNGKEGFHKEESKIEGESTKGSDAGKVAQTTATGAEVGTLAGLGSGHAIKGLGIGSAAGAAGGLIWVLASRGKDILLPSGTNLELELSSPLTFEESEIEPPSKYQNGPSLPRPERNPEQ